MRILDLNNSYSPDGGGIRVYHEEKVAYYGRGGGHDYALMVPGRKRQVLRRGRSTLYELPSVAVPGTASRFVVRPGLVRGVIEDFRPDLVEIGSVELLPLYLARILRRRPAATVAFFHQDYPESYVRAPLERFGGGLAGAAERLARRHARWLYGGATAAFAASGFAAARLRELGVRRVFRTPLGVDTATFNPSRRSGELRASLGAVEGRRLVLFAGRLATEKGIDLLTEAWPLVAGRESLVLAVAGHGPRERAMAPFFAAHPEVRRLPYRKDRAETAALLASADLVLCLGRRETFSLVTLEAMACGTPVVTAPTGGAAELVAEAGGPPPFDGTAPGLARAVAARAGDRREDSARRLAAWAGERHDWRRSLDGITAAYEAVLAAYRAGDLRPLEGGGL